MSSSQLDVLVPESDRSELEKELNAGSDSEELANNEHQQQPIPQLDQTPEAIDVLLFYPLLSLLQEKDLEKKQKKPKKSGPVQGLSGSLSRGPSQ